MSDQDSLWIRRFAPAPDIPVQLVCFPHVGGSAAFYVRMAAALCPKVDVLAVQYPGRLDRRREPPLESVAELADQVTTALAAWHDRPLALFGHSLGAVVAFEVARRLERDGRPPLAMFASARRAPSRVRPESAHLLDNDALIREVRTLGGTDPRIFDDDELIALALPVIRADYRAVETYRYVAGTPLTCPLIVLTGQDDQKVSLEDARAWAGHTTERCEVVTLPGGHFYLNEQLEAVTAIVVARLCAESARRRTRDNVSWKGAT